jgi:DNA-binding transcriptional ArsR family regulator
MNKGSQGSPRELIIEVLRKHPEGLTITAISEFTKLHRHTVTKYLYELRGAEMIYEREIGPARLCYLKDGVTKKKERETIKRLNNHNMKSSLGQIQIIAVVLFLVLAPAAIIAAQNATNFTENVSIPLEGYITANNEGVTSRAKTITHSMNLSRISRTKPVRMDRSLNL